MADAIVKRGPDSDGYWVDDSAGIGLAHRRLAIVDLSPAGAQPMTSSSGRYVLAFNGEVYNHLILRAEIERSKGPPQVWGGHSDTETLRFVGHRGHFAAFNRDVCLWRVGQAHSQPYACP
jgi:asparagine synthase (glutamine-hydrolysing)